jgi:autophagy-related protein 18
MSEQNQSLETLNFINFNQDGTCFSIGTNKGYKIFNCDPFGKCFQRTDLVGTSSLKSTAVSTQTGIGIVEMLFSTSLIAITGLGDQPSMSPRRLKIINTKRNSTICELNFPTSILSIKLNKSRLFVLLEEQIYVYDITNMRLLHTIETSPNPSGISALSPSVENNFFVYPSLPKLATNPFNVFNDDEFTNTSNSNQQNPHQSLQQLNQINHNNSNNNTNINSNSNSNNNNSSKQHNGDVVVFNATALQPVIVIEAHKTPLAAIAISYDGTLLATASDKGTIVRVFSTETGLKLYQFRRGTYPTKIYALSFSKDNRFLTASSATETVHIFKLGVDLSEEQYQEISNSDVYKGKNARSGSQSSDFSAMASNNRRISVSSYDSIASSDVNDDPRSEPLIDRSRKSVARMIRKSSQNIGRRAAEKIGTFLPPKLTSMLEPNRHFASLKIPAQNGVKNVVAVGQEVQISKSGLPLAFSEGTPPIDEDENDVTTITNGESSNAGEETLVNLIHILVVSSEGYFYKYGLDPERGGDCILLNQYSLMDSY